MVGRPVYDEWEITAREGFAGNASDGDGRSAADDRRHSARVGRGGRLVMGDGRGREVDCAHAVTVPLTVRNIFHSLRYNSLLSYWINMIYIT